MAVIAGDVAIAESANRLDMCLESWLTQEFPQALNVHVYRAFVDLIGRAPHPHHQLLSIENPAGMRFEEIEQPSFDRPQMFGILQLCDCRIAARPRA